MAAPNKIDPARKERLKRALKEEAPNLERLKADTDTKKRDAFAATVMLQRSVQDQHIDLDLGGGAVIGIRTRLSQIEIKHLGTVMDRRGDLAREKAGTTNGGRLEEIDAELEDLWFEIIEIITLDETLTREWLKTNPDRYNREDLLSIWLGYLEGQKRLSAEREERVKKSISFRAD